MSRHYGATVALFRLAMRALAIDVRHTGAEHIPSNGPVLFACTHVSYPDFVFVQEAASARDRELRFMCRHDVWNKSWAGWFMDGMQHIPVDREAPAGAFLHARRMLEDGHAVAIFPEAGISYSYTVRPLMRGLAGLARATGAPVIPSAIWGSQRVYSVGVPEPPFDYTRGRRIDVAFGSPLYAEPDADLTAWTRDLGHVLTEMLEELQAQPHHQPRPGEHAPWHPAHLGGHAPTRAVAQEHDVLPIGAVRPTWGPDLDAFDWRDDWL